MNNEDKIHLLMDDSRGVYMPQNFAEMFDASLWSGIKSEDLEDLLKGPEDYLYWDTWDRILNNAKWINEKDGHTWTLWQDGDLFIIRDDYEFYEY